MKAPLSPGPRLQILCYLSITLDRLKAPLGLKPGSPILFSLCNSNVHTLLAYGHGKVCPKAGAASLESHYADGYPDVNASRGPMGDDQLLPLPEFHILQTYVCSSMRYSVESANVYDKVKQHSLHYELTCVSPYISKFLQLE